MNVVRNESARLSPEFEALLDNEVYPAFNKIVVQVQQWVIDNGGTPLDLILMRSSLIAGLELECMDRMADVLHDFDAPAQPESGQP